MTCILVMFPKTSTTQGLDTVDQSTLTAGLPGCPGLYRITANPVVRQPDAGDQARQMMQQMAAMNAMMGPKETRALAESLQLETEDEVEEYVAMMGENGRVSSR